MEVPIIRICNLALSAVSVAAVAVSPVHAKRDDGQKQLNRYVEARLAEAGNQTQQAVAIYSDSLKQQPDNTLVASKAYVKAIEVGDFPLAVKAVRTLELNGSLNAEMPLLLFGEAFAKRDWRAADIALLELENLKNFAFMVPILESWLNVAKRDFDAVDLQKIRTSSTGKYYYEEQRLLHLLASGNEDTAAPILARIVKSNDIRMGPIRALAARHFAATGQDEKAIEVLSMKRTGPEARLLSAIEAGQGQAKKIDGKTGAAFALQRLSADLGSQQAEFLALVSAQVAKQINPGEDFSHLMLGRSYQLIQNRKGARQAFAEMSSDSAYYFVALNAEINSFIDDELYEAAEKRLDSAIARNRSFPELFILKGQVLQAKNSHAEAVPAYQEAIRLAEARDASKPLLANYYLALGSAQEQGGLWPEGLDSLKKANDLLPNSASILNYLGYAQLERRENTAAAVEVIEQAHKLRSSSPAITDSLGWAYYLSGDHQRAVDYLEQALSGQPDDPTINEHLGDAYWTVGRKFEARYAWSSAKIFADNGDIDRLTSKIDVGLRPETVSP